MQIISQPKLVILTYYGRSGSYLLHSLLDGANKTLNLPCDLYILWDLIKINSAKCQSEQAFVDTLYLEMYRYFFDSNQDLLTYPNVEEEFSVFKSHYMALIDAYTKHFRNSVIARFMCIHHAFALARKIEIQMDDCTIIHQVHVPCSKRIREVMSAFQGVKHVQMLREPIAGLSSLIKTHARAREGVSSFFNLFEQTLIGGCDIQLNGGRSIGLKLEDLHHQPEVKMQQLIRFLEIDWSANLLVETTLGQKAQVYDGFTEGFDYAKTMNNNQKHRALFSSFDISRMESLMFSRYKTWGYTIADNAFIEYRDLKPMLDYQFNFECYSAEQESPHETEKRMQSGREYNMNFLIHYVARNQIPANQLIEVL